MGAVSLSLGYLEHTHILPRVAEIVSRRSCWVNTNPVLAFFSLPLLEPLGQSVSPTCGDLIIPERHPLGAVGEDLLFLILHVVVTRAKDTGWWEWVYPFLFLAPT